MKHPWFKEQTLDDGTEAVKIGIQRRHSQLLRETEERLQAEARAAAQIAQASRPAPVPQRPVPVSHQTVPGARTQ